MFIVNIIVIDVMEEDLKDILMYEENEWIKIVIFDNGIGFE